MAFKISGTTVIDNNANIVNVGISTLSRLDVGTGGTTFVAISTTGRVGILSANPQSALSVGGTITELYNNQFWNVVSQSDIGIGASQIPTNGMLGGMAYQNSSNVSVGNISADSYDNGLWTSEKTFNVQFPTGTLNQKVQIYWPTGSRLQGGYEVTIAAGFEYAQASGMLRKTYGIHAAENGALYLQTTTVPFALGAISSWFTISNIQWDSVNRRWYLIIANLAGTPNGGAVQSGNSVTISVRSYINPVSNSVWLNARASAASISPIYTTDTTVYPILSAPITDNNGNFLIGAATSTGTVSQPLQVTGGAYISGNLGVGGTNPGISSVKLLVVGDDVTPYSNTGTSPSGHRVSIVNNNSVGTDSCVSVLSFSSINAEGFNSTSWIANLATPGSEGDFGRGGTMVFGRRVGNNSAETLRLTRIGNVGIGSTQPSTKLDVNGVISVSAGTTSAPAIIPISDSNTGVFFPSLDTFAVATNGTERIKVSAAGTFAFGGPSAGFSTNKNYHFYTLGNAVLENASFYFESTQDLSNVGGRQYGIYVNQRGARYTNQTAIYAQPLEVFGANYRGVHGVTLFPTQAGGTTEAIFGETTIPEWNYQGRHCAVRGIAQGGSTVFSNTYGLTSANGAFGGHFVAYGKADVCGVYADAYQLASPGAGTTAVPLMVATNGTELMRVTTGGELLVGTATRTANGGKIQVSNGITFPAVQSACSDANTLDDYEEGTWTPVIPGTSITYTTQLGVYTKIGNLVFIKAFVTLAGGTPTGGAGAAIITGLPFTCEATHYWTLTTSTNGGNFGGTVPIAQVIPSTTTISAFAVTNNATFVDSTATSVWDANGNWVQVAGCYRV